jgi:hypothetical protein
MTAAYLIYEPCLKIPLKTCMGSKAKPNLNHWVGGVEKNRLAARAPVGRVMRGN